MGRVEIWSVTMASPVDESHTAELLQGDDVVPNVGRRLQVLRVGEVIPVLLGNQVLGVREVRDCLAVFEAEVPAYVVGVEVGVDDDVHVLRVGGP